MTQIFNSYCPPSLGVAQEESGLGMNTTTDSRGAAAGSCQPTTFFEGSFLLKENLGGAPSWLPQNFMSKTV